MERFKVILNSLEFTVHTTRLKGQNTTNCAIARNKDNSSVYLILEEGERSNAELIGQMQDMLNSPAKGSVSV